jgi:hypothetical protein
MLITNGLKNGFYLVSINCFPGKNYEILDETNIEESFDRRI